LRAHLEASARRGGPGSEDARAQLDVPPCPEEMEHLVAWTYELAGRSGEGFSGFARVSHREIATFAQLMDLDLEPHEVEALRRLDDALLHPDEVAETEEGDGEAPEPHRPEVPQWKQRPAGVEPQFERRLD
jgi:hypothetical protein